LASGEEEVEESDDDRGDRGREILECNEDRDDFGGKVKGLGSRIRGIKIGEGFEGDFWGAGGSKSET
jgi:hypothetical protein